MTVLELKKELKRKADPEKAKVLQRFFKTGPGEYGEGDRFLGIVVPELRKLAKQFLHLKLSDLQKLIVSPIHEERLVTLFVLVYCYQKNKNGEQQSIYEFYLKNKKYVNNWDLVDLSASYIVGHYLVDKDKKLLFELAQSESLWDRRIAIISTFYFIRQNQFKETLKISKSLLKDEHDLIHKAVGWMLREIGKRDLQVEEDFLKKHYKRMPRTMLRYAIERFPELRRQAYLKGTI